MEYVTIGISVRIKKCKKGRQYKLSQDAESFEKAANNVAYPFACLTDTVTVTALDALADIDVLAAVNQAFAALAVFEAVDEQAQRHVLAALEHALAQFLLETAGTTSVMGAAVHAVHSVAVAAKISALEESAAGVHAVVVAAARGVMHGNATAANSLWPLPVILLYCRPWILIDYDNCLRSSIDEHLLVILNGNWIRIWLIILIRMRWAEVVVGLIAVIMRSCWLISEVHGNSVQIGLFVYLCGDIVDLILSVIGIGLKVIVIIDAILPNNIWILRELASSNFLLGFNFLDGDLILFNHICIPIDAIGINDLFFGMRGTFSVIYISIHCLYVVVVITLIIFELNIILISLNKLTLSSRKQYTLYLHFLKDFI